MSISILGAGTVVLAVLSYLRDTAFDASRAVGPIDYRLVLASALLNAVGPLLLSLVFAGVLWVLARPIRPTNYKTILYGTWATLIALTAYRLVSTIGSWIIM